MRKNRYLNMQKNNDAKKAEAFTAGSPLFLIVEADPIKKVGPPKKD